MRIEVTVADDAGGSQDAVVHAEPKQLNRDVISALIGDGRSAYHGVQPVDPAQSLRESDIRSGSIVTARPALSASPIPRAPLLAVTGGAAAGSWIGAEVGRPYRVGRNPNNDLVVNDRTVSGQHATIVVQADGSLVVTDHGADARGSTNGTYVRGVRIDPRIATACPVDEPVILGQAIIQAVLKLPPAGAVQRAADGSWFYNRPPGDRHKPHAVPQVQSPGPAADRASRSILMTQLGGSGMAVVFGVGWALKAGNLVYALVGVLGAALLVTGVLLTTRSSRRETRQRQATYRQELHEAQQQLADAAKKQREHGVHATLDPVAAALAARLPSNRLWAADGRSGPLMVRLGSRDNAVEVDIVGARNPEVVTPKLAATPVNIDLRESPVFGIAGADGYARGCARAVVHQIAVAHAPDELAIVHLAATPSHEWEWLRWLPHIRAFDDELHTVSPSAEALSLRLDELLSMLTRRTSLRDYGYQYTSRLLPEILVILEDAHMVRHDPTLVRVLREGPGVGIFVLAVAEDPSLLPQECEGRFVIEPVAGGPYVARLVKQAGGSWDKITPDLLSVAYAATSARAIAPLTPLGRSGSDSLPDTVLLRDLVGRNTSLSTEVTALWDSSTEGRAVVGIDERGNQVVLDLARYPHALVAGIVGAGKSEFLRTLLSGLAMSADPDDLALLLIDYKGGGAFGRLRELPHVTGYADNLTIGGVLSDRLLASLRAEIDRRELLFKDAGQVEDLKRYRQVRRDRPDLLPLTRLVIAVDEFAQLKQQQPRFIDGLVEVARLGRALGMHLILATQQPVGIVSPQIKDNSDLRICLRVADPSTSNDLVNSPVAATFPSKARGRAAIKSGDNLLITQSGYFSSPPANAAVSDTAVAVRPLPWLDCGLPLAVRTNAEDEDGGATTDLTRFVRAASEAWEGHPKPVPPWLPPLEPLIPIAELSATDEPIPPNAVAFAREDQPVEQKQPPCLFTLGQGNMAFPGGPKSGRSTALCTVAGALAARFSADELQLHVIDFSPAATLTALRPLKHCGTIATRRERDKATRLVEYLHEELERRGQLLTAHPGTPVRELAAYGHHVPHIVVLVDGWEATRSTGIGDSLNADLLKLIEDGPQLGLQFVIAGGTGLSNPNVLHTIDNLICLQFEQSSDLSLFGVPRSAIPATIPPGRGLRSGSGDAVQIAQLANTQAEQFDEISRIAQSTAAPSIAPRRIESLPTSTRLADLTARSASDSTTSPMSVIVGVGGDDLSPRAVDLARVQGAFAVIGRDKTGRTTALATIAAQLRQQQIDTVVVLDDLKDAELFPGLTVGTWRVGERPRFRKDGVLIIDDSQVLANDDEIMQCALAMEAVCVVFASDPSAFQIVGYPPGWRNGFKVRMGLVLCPREPDDGFILGAKFEPQDRFAGPAGRAYLIRPGVRPERVQVPLAGRDEQ